MEKKASSNDAIKINFSIRDYKSYFGSDWASITIDKPITIIAGPNGEGKTNYLEAMFYVLSQYINWSSKLSKNSILKEKVIVSDRYKHQNKKINLQTSLYEYIFSDFLCKDLHPAKKTIEEPERYQIDTFKPKNKKNPNSGLWLSIYRKSKTTEGNKILGKFQLSFPKYCTLSYVEKEKESELENIDVIYLQPDNNLIDLVSKLVAHQLWSEKEKIKGANPQAEFVSNIWKFGPKSDKRMLSDIHKGEFQDKKTGEYLKFESLATGTKKEILLYLLGLLKQRNKNYKNWCGIIFIDEIENGFHSTLLIDFIKRLTDIFENDEILKNKVKIVMTTHSPTVFTKLSQHHDIVNIYFALSKGNKNTSELIHYNEVMDDPLQKKKMLVELGLSIYELPKKILFVEGPTEKYFFEQFLPSDIVKIIPMNSCKMNTTTQELLERIPLASQKEYLVLVDKKNFKESQKCVNNLIETIDMKIDHINFDSLEEFLFSLNLNLTKTENSWNKIEESLNRFNSKIPDFSNVVPLNLQATKKNMGKKEDGPHKFLLSIKKKEQFYRQIGSHWETVLGSKQKETIKKTIKWVND